MHKKLIKRKGEHPDRGGNEPDEILERLCSLECVIAAQTLAIGKLHKQGEKIMSELTDLQDAVAEVKTDLANEKAEVTAELKKLQDKIDAGSPVTKQDLIDLTASVKEIGAGIKDIVTPSP